MSQHARRVLRVTASLAGTALAGPAGGVIGQLLGSVLGASIPAITDLISDVASNLTADAIQTGSTALINRLNPQEKQHINHDLQTAFRDALVEAVYDIGGRSCFGRIWQEKFRDVPANVSFLDSDEGFLLRQRNPDRAGDACLFFNGLVTAVEQETILPLNPPADRPAAAVLTYLEAETPEALSDALFRQVLAPYLNENRAILLELPNLEFHLHQHLLDRTIIHLGELLKERTPAWRAFNRLILQNIQQELRDQGQAQIEILARLDNLTGHNLADFSDGTASLLGAVGRIEKQVDEGFDKILDKVAAHHAEILQRLDILVGIDQKLDILPEMNQKLDILLGSDRFARSSLPAEAKFFIPNPPREFIARSKELVQLRQMVLASEKTEVIGLTAVKGWGGVGKSALVKAFCQEPLLHQVFPDGAVMLTVGKETAGQREILLQELKIAGEKLRLPGFNPTSLEAGISYLSQWMQDKGVLIVLDDVWHNGILEPIRSIRSPHSHIIVTTRVDSVAGRAGNKILDLAVFNPEDSQELLRKLSGKDEPKFPQIADLLGHLPLALNIAGIWLRTDSAENWLDTYSRKISSLIVLDASDPQKRENSLTACFDVSADELAEHKSLYHSLGVFPEDKWVSTTLIIRFWQKITGETDEQPFKILIKRLSNLALIELNAVGKTVHLHDLLHDYNRVQMERDQVLQPRHNDLLTVLGAAGDWFTHPGDDKIYLCQHLPHHLTGADRQAELIPFFKETVVWMEENLAEPDQILEELLVGIWRSYWADNQAGARNYLLTTWLPRKIRQGQTGYTARMMAVWCAFEVDFDEGLAMALSHKDERIQAAAVNYVYYLSQGDHHHRKRALKILESLRSRLVNRWGIPDPAAIKTIFLLAPLMVIDQYQARGDSPGPDNGHILQDTIALLTGSFNDILSKSVLRFSGTTSRKFMVGRIVKLFNYLYQDKMETATINNLKGFNLFFAHDEPTRLQIISKLKYLNREYGTFDEIEPVIFDLLRTDDRISVLIAEFIESGRGVSQPLAMLNLIQRIQAQFDDPGLYILYHCVHMLYSIVEHLKPEQIPASTLDTIREFVIQWIETTRPDYGTVRYSDQQFQIYPLAYYAAVWTKLKPGVEVDLMREYFDQAEEAGDMSLHLHLIASFGDFTQKMSDYPAALQTLEPYFLIAETNQKIAEQLEISLGSLRSLQPDAVDGLLKEANASPPLEAAIRSYSYRKPSSGLYHRFFQLLFEVVAYAPLEFVEKIIVILEKSLTTPSLDKMMATLIDELIVNFAQSPEESG